MDTRNAHAEHIGLVTIDRNVSHTHWPCVSHPPEISCADAVRLALKKPWRALPAQSSQRPQRDWVEHR